MRPITAPVWPTHKRKRHWRRRTGKGTPQPAFAPLEPPAAEDPGYGAFLHWMRRQERTPQAGTP